MFLGPSGFERMCLRSLFGTSRGFVLFGFMLVFLRFVLVGLVLLRLVFFMFCRLFLRLLC